MVAPSSPLTRLPAKMPTLMAVVSGADVSAAPGGLLAEAVRMAATLRF